jgi:hypothetical protein
MPAKPNTSPKSAPAETVTRFLAVASPQDGAVSRRQQARITDVSSLEPCRQLSFTTAD